MQYIFLIFNDGKMKMCHVNENIDLLKLFNFSRVHLQIQYICNSIRDCIFPLYI